jgi:hypothetical protein
MYPRDCRSGVSFAGLARGGPKLARSNPVPCFSEEGGDSRPKPVVSMYLRWLSIRAQASRPGQVPGKSADNDGANRDHTNVCVSKVSLYIFQPKHGVPIGKSPKSAKQTFQRTKPKQPSHNPLVSPVWGTDVDRPARTPITTFATSASHEPRSIEWLESLNSPLLLSGSCFSLFPKGLLTKSASERAFKTDDGLEM